jgi:hypothetical protein
VVGRVYRVAEEGGMVVVSSQGLFECKTLIIPFALPLGLDAIGTRRFSLVTFDASFTASCKLVVRSAAKKLESREEG